VLDGAALRRGEQLLLTPQVEVDEDPAGQIEGELGVAIGTGGYREEFGTAVVPLGKDGTAILSFDHVESHRGRWRRR